MDSNNWTAFFSLNVEDTQISSCIENQEPQIRYNNTSTISSGISSASDVQIFSPPFSAPIAKSTDSGMLISLDDGASIHSSDSFYEDEAKLIELIEETFADCNSLPFHCLLPCIRKVVGSNPQVFEVFPSVKGTLQVRCITKKVKFLNPDNAMSVRSVREEDIEWMKDTRSVLSDLPDHIKSVNASIMHVISPTLLLCSVSGPERVRILHNLMSKHEDKLIKPNSLTPGRLYIMKINNLLGRFVLLSQADQPGLFYSAAVDSNYIIKHDTENMYNCLWYFHTAVHPGRLFLARLRGNVKLNADDMHIISQYNVMYPDGYVPYQPVAIFSVSERVYLVDWIHNTTWISDQLKDSIVVEKDPALENAEGIFNQKWNPDSLPDTPEGILSNMYSTLPLYHSSINLPDGWFVNCLSFIEQLFVNDEADIIPNIMCLAKRLMNSQRKKRGLKSSDKDAYELLLKLERLYT